MNELEKLAKLLRYYILLSSTTAGSGHPTSSLSSVELMTGLFFGGFLRYDIRNSSNPLNDKVIFSKGHATPLFYSLWKVAGAISESELLGYRKFGNDLEGHPSINFPYTEAATGSLGQGLSIGVGFALDSKYIKKTNYQSFVLLGDGEMAEGSVWEAIQLASHYKLNNLIGILDVNRMGQTGETMLGKAVKEYAKRVSSFGWQVITIDGHSFKEIIDAYFLAESSDRPVMIIAQTIKGKGVSFLEYKEGWHGKALKKDEFEKASKELGDVDKGLIGKIKKPVASSSVSQDENETQKVSFTNYPKAIKISTRQAYGNALVKISHAFSNMVVLDGDVSNSTFSEIFKKESPKHFFEMYIAEQNMAGAALGLARSGKTVFASTFSAFWSRAHDQIRMAGLSEANIKFIGSHAGVSIGADGPSQMGLEDLALFRSVWCSTVLYPCDAISTEKLVFEAVNHKGLVYIRTTRGETPVIYGLNEEFPVGGSKTLKISKDDRLTIVASGITVFEALKAYKILNEKKIYVRVIDVYSIKPIDKSVLLKAAKETGGILVVEDHYPEGGVVDAVREAFDGKEIKVWSLAVRKKPKSGKPEELLNYEEIDANAIVNKVHELLI